MTMLTADYHVHSISPDAGVPMEEMCESAIQKGMDEIAFTDHYEFYAHGVVKEYFHEEYLKLYWRSLEMCREKFEGRLVIRRGLEIGQMHLCPENAFAVISKYPFDFIIGSLHKIENVDVSQMEYTERTMPHIAEAYYRHLIRLSEVGEFDCLGHLDLIKRHSVKNGLPDYYDKYEKEITRVLRNLVSRGKGIEINTSGIRQGTGESMPAIKTVRLFAQLGGTVVTVGSDAHRPEDVGADFYEAEKLLKEAGFKEVTRFERRRGLPVKI
jgi:histidinol-phosphatase (PHP family)